MSWEQLWLVRTGSSGVLLLQGAPDDFIHWGRRQPRGWDQDRSRDWYGGCEGKRHWSLYWRYSWHWNSHCLLHQALHPGRIHDLLAVLWRWCWPHVTTVFAALRLHYCSLYSLCRSALAVLEPLQVLLLSCPLQSCINQQPQVTEILSGEQLWGSGRRCVEEAIGGASCHCVGETSTLFLRFPQKTLCIKLHQRLDRFLLTGVAGSCQNSCCCVPKKTEVQCGGRADDRRSLLGWVAFWRDGSTSIRRVAFIFTANLAGDGKLGGIFAILAKQVREEAATRIDKPVTDLGKEWEWLSEKRMLFLKNR